LLLPRPADSVDGGKRIRALSWCAACRSTNASSRAASDVDQLVRLERDVFQASAAARRERPVARVLPQVALREMLLAFREGGNARPDVAHHHIQRGTPLGA